jgi:hypothetical protein
MKYVFILLITLISLSTYTQNVIQITGVISDGTTDEKLIGANIYVDRLKKGVTSDQNGNYSLELPDTGEYEIRVTYIGFEEWKKQMNFSKSTHLNISMESSSSAMDEIIVKDRARDHNITSTEMSVEKLSILQIEKIPIIMGETDIFKTLQLLPGITGIAEGRAGFVVRGSGLDQNLILMDGMPLYYSSHMQGLFSVFNSDAIDGLTIYKGGIPARYGGRGASVLDVRMKESNFEKYKVNLSVGLITSKLSIEAPIIKDKLSVFIAGRSTKQSIGSLYDRIKFGKDEIPSGGKTDPDKGKTNGGSFNFFDTYESWNDINGKIIFKINEDNTLFFSGYFGTDHAITVAGLTDWGNRAGLLKWRHAIRSNLISNTSLIHSQYFTQSNSGRYSFNSGIATTSVKQDFLYFPKDGNEYRFGFSSEYQDFNHGGLEDITEDDAGKFMPPMQGLESAVYVENDRRINSKFSALIGLRYSTYHRLGPGDSFTYDEESNEAISSVPHKKYTDVMAFYHNLEPRLALTYIVDKASSIKLSYNRNVQYLRLMSLGGEIEWFDIWMPSTENIRPMLTDQVAMGYFRNFRNDAIKFSVETYFKWIDGTADFEDGLHNYLVNNLEAYVATGKGKAYGLEVSIEKPVGRFNGRLSYNLGSSDVQIDAINQGRWYPNRFDITNSLSILASYELFKNLTISSTFVYTTGRPATLPEAYYNVSGVNFPYWEGRNKYRLPDYHRLDFGIKYEPKFLVISLKKYNREITPSFEISLYNVYNRRNIHTINFSQNSIGKGDPNGTNAYQAYGISTFGFVPSFQFHLKF